MPGTVVAIDGEAWLINGKPTYRGREYRDRRIEGLLLNSRMANAIFDDTNPATRFLWRYRIPAPGTLTATATSSSPTCRCTVSTA